MAHDLQDVARMFASACPTLVACFNVSVFYQVALQPNPLCGCPGINKSTVTMLQDAKVAFLGWGEDVAGNILSRPQRASWVWDFGG